MTLTSQQARTPVSVSPNVAYKGSPHTPRPQHKKGMSPAGIAAVVVVLAVVGTGIGYLVLREPTTSKESVLKPADPRGADGFGPSADPLGGRTASSSTSPGPAAAATPPAVELSMRPPGLNGGASSPGTPGAPTIADPLATPGASAAGARPTSTPVSNPPTLSQPSPVQPVPTQPAPTRSAPGQPAQPAASPTQPSPTPASPTQPGQPAQPGQPGMTQPIAPPPPPSMSQVLLAEADRQQSAGKLVDARGTLNRALLDPSSSAADRAAIRARMSELNQTLVFSPTIAPGDTLSESYSVVSGDSIEKIMRKQGLLPDKMLIARVNKMADPNRLSIGQKLKLVKGPFHAVVSKSQFRIDLYAGDAASAGTIGTSGLPDGAEPGWLYITSFPVGLGERGPDGKGGTPLGNYVVKASSKLVNPHWVNPRTGEKFAADDPKNPIGERWLGLEGLDDASKKFTGYGIHGTIDPASIGREMSMGCVRLNSGDVEVVYELLTSRVSVVKIVP